MIFNLLLITPRREGDSPPRITRRGGSLRIRLQELSYISHMVLGHRLRSIRRAAAAGGSGRALGARPDLRLPGPAGWGPYPGRRVAARGGSGRIRPSSGPKHSSNMLPSGKRGRREFPKLPASHANRRAWLCAAVVHHRNPSFQNETPNVSPQGTAAPHIARL